MKDLEVSSLLVSYIDGMHMNLDHAGLITEFESLDNRVLEKIESLVLPILVRNPELVQNQILPDIVGSLPENQAKVKRICKNCNKPGHFQKTCKDPKRAT